MRDKYKSDDEYYYAKLSHQTNYIEDCPDYSPGCKERICSGSLPWRTPHKFYQPINRSQKYIAVHQATEQFLLREYNFLTVPRDVHTLAFRPVAEKVLEEEGKRTQYEEVNSRLVDSRLMELINNPEFNFSRAATLISRAKINHSLSNPTNIYELFFRREFSIERKNFDEGMIETRLNFDTKRIYINKNLTHQGMRFVLAKLFSKVFLLGVDYNKNENQNTITTYYKSLEDPDLTEDEICIDILATSLLIPNLLFYSSTKEFNFYKTYAEWGVPADVLAYRFSIDFYLGDRPLR